MLSKRAQDLKQTYTSDEFKSGNGLERYFIHLLNPDLHDLTATEERYLEKLRTTWYILTKNLSTKKRVKLICEKIDCHPKQVFKYMREAQELFGEVLKTDAIIELTTMKERYYILGDAAAKKENIEEARKCYQAAEECIAKIEALTPIQRRVFTAVVFSSDPSILTNNGEPEDIEYEDAEEE